MYHTYTGGEAPPPITAIQNSQAPSEFLATSIPKQKPKILLIFANIKSSYGFCFGIEVVKNSEEAVVFYIAVMGGLRPPYKYGTKYTSPLRVFDNFNFKAKTIGTFNFSKN